MKIAVLLFAVTIPALCVAQTTSTYDPWFGTTIKSKPHESAVEKLKKEWKQSKPDASMGEKLGVPGDAQVSGPGGRLDSGSGGSTSTTKGSGGSGLQH